MGRPYHIDIAGKTYAGQTANAKAQFEALHIAGRTGVVSMLDGEASDMALVAVLLQTPLADVQRLAALVVQGLVKCDEIPVAENLFGDEIHNYFLLIAQALRENVGPFWQLRRPNEKPAAEPIS